MNRRMILLAAAVLAVLPASLGAVAIAAAPKKAVCAVCGPREGAGAEPVKARATYQGKEYFFCTEKCRDEFLKDPQAILNLSKPRPAPAFSLKDLNGNTVALNDYKGKVVLLDFWATFCSPCVAAMPDLQKLHEKYGAQGFSVIGIATDDKPDAIKLVPSIVAKKRVKYPILLTNEAAWTNYQVETLPALFLIDRKGQIVRRFGGKTDHKEIEGEVARLLREAGK